MATEDRTFEYPSSLPFLVRYLHLLPLLLLPFWGAVSGRSASTVLIILAILLVIDRIFYGHKPYLLVVQKQLLPCFTLLVMSWLALSVFWSIDSANSLSRLGKLLVVVIPGLYCAFALDDRKQNHNFWPFLTSLIIGTSIVFYYAFLVPTGDHPHFLGVFEITTPYNRNLMIVLLSSVILLNAIICHWAESTLSQRLLTITIFIFCALMSLKMELLSQILLVLVWGVTVVFIRLFPSGTTLVCAAGIIFTMLLFPALPAVFTFFIELIYDSVPPFLQSSYTGDGRFTIWQISIEYSKEHPFLGYGLGTEMLLPLIPLHPHSASLNILLNTGLVGSVLFTLLALLYVRHCWMKGDAYLIKTLPVFMALFAFANVNHGAWQSWWVALAFIALNPNLGLHRR